MPNFHNQFAIRILASLVLACNGTSALCCELSSCKVEFQFRVPQHFPFDFLRTLAARPHWCCTVGIWSVQIRIGFTRSLRIGIRTRTTAACGNQKSL
jgi:hypothetical protein